MTKISIRLYNIKKPMLKDGHSVRSVGHFMLKHTKASSIVIIGAAWVYSCLNFELCCFGTGTNDSAKYNNLTAKEFLDKFDTKCLATLKKRLQLLEKVGLAKIDFRRGHWFITLNNNCKDCKRDNKYKIASEPNNSFY